MTGGVLTCILEKAYIAVNGYLKVILMRTQKEKTRESFELLREYLGNFQQSKNMSGKDHSYEVSEMRNNDIIDRLDIDDRYR